jgi:pilus assembly protein CpaE
LAIHVALLSTDQRLEETLRAAGVTATRVDRENRGGKSQQAGHPAAIVVDVRGQSQLPATLPALRKEHPGASVILVASTLDPRLMLDAMRAGVNECVQEPLTPEALNQAIRKVVSGSQPESAGQVFAFVGAKGGVGTTTLAVNTATMLARAGKADVLLIDLHVGHGDAALLLGVEPRFSVVDAL